MRQARSLTGAVTAEHSGTVLAGFFPLAKSGNVNMAVDKQRSPSASRFRSLMSRASASPTLGSFGCHPQRAQYRSCSAGAGHQADRSCGSVVRASPARRLAHPDDGRAQPVSRSSSPWHGSRERRRWSCRFPSRSSPVWTSGSRTPQSTPRAGERAATSMRSSSRTAASRRPARSLPRWA